MAKYSSLLILLLIAFSSFAAISIKYCKGDKLEYSYSGYCSSPVGFSSAEGYTEIINIDSIAYISSDTFYYYNRLGIKYPNDTFYDNIGYYTCNSSEIIMKEDSLVLYRISKLSPDIDTLFINYQYMFPDPNTGNHIGSYCTILLNNDTIINVNGISLQALQGSYSRSISGASLGQTTNVLFSDIYGLYDFYYFAPHGPGWGCTYLRHLNKIDHQTNIIHNNSSMILGRKVISKKANNYLLNGKILVNIMNFDDNAFKYKQFILSK